MPPRLLEAYWVALLQLAPPAVLHLLLSATQASCLVGGMLARVCLSQLAGKQLALLEVYSVWLSLWFGENDLCGCIVLPVQGYLWLLAGAQLALACSPSELVAAGLAAFVIDDAACTCLVAACSLAAGTATQDSVPGANRSS